ncbi:MAG TPA: J domain-containing protein [Thermomicrobiales bacterium]|nr:J domain-containing protein [Thermomicrobiales bacterium]
MQFQDYYSILGVPRNADEKAIKRAYRELARKLHPDVNNEPDAEERFKALNEAHQVLSDSEKRAKYDRFGADWERYQTAPDNGAGTPDFSQWFTGSGAGDPNVRYEYRSSGGEGFSDFFETLFGSTPARGRSRGRAARRGEDHEYTVDVPLREAFSGTERVFDIQAAEVCSACRGAGMTARELCGACDATGSISRKSRIEVTIPAGIRDGQKVRVAGKGSPGSEGGPAGDIYLRVKVRPDAQFTLEGSDLKTSVAVPLYTAMLGGEVIVNTLAGKVSLTIPPETQNGRVFRLKGQGWPVAIGSRQRGDLLAKVNVVLPKDLNEQEHELFERLQAERAADRASTVA